MVNYTHQSLNRLRGEKPIPLLLLSLLLFTLFPASSEGVRCDFLPEEPPPKWITSGWTMPGHYVGVGVSERKDSVEAQLEASKQSALNEISMKISVSVSSTIRDTLKSSSRGGSDDVEQEVEAVTESSVKQTLRDVDFPNKWLNRDNCQLWTLAVISEKTVKAIQEEMKEKLAKKYTSKMIMFFPLGENAALPEMKGRFKGNLESIFRELGLEVKAPEAEFLPCAKGEKAGVCEKLPNTIFAGYDVTFKEEKKSSDGKSRARFFAFDLNLYLKNQNISSFRSETCKGVGSALKSDEEIDLLSADSCVKKIRKKLVKDMQGSEK
ncbi:MAG: LPP20 family lipoprotein [Nitrospinota bacterium]|nr:LPP20 family lipoprotein [Nitrospinota bacterium]